MKREDFIKIIKLRSNWKVDRRTGDYNLPGGVKLSRYIRTLVEAQLDLDVLGILEDGNLALRDGGKWNEQTKDFDDFILIPTGKESESCTYEEQEKRIRILVKEIVG